MNDNTQDDFSIFATSKRIKKEEPGAYKSPLDTGTKWSAQEENRVEERTEIRIEKRPEVHIEKKVEMRAEAPRSVSASNNNEEIGNIGSELQKFRKYPTKTYDKFLNKMVTFNEEEFYLIRDLSAEISLARKRSSIANKGSLPRITENTVIRAALKAVFSKIGSNNTDLTTLQTEEALESYFNSLLK
ncbi:MAG: hypothetical protein H7281_15220 [Bacteriovorax sp.]|nr:hypothetical protein [Bacteriovorax sp.]